VKYLSFLFLFAISLLGCEAEEDKKPGEVNPETGFIELEAPLIPSCLYNVNEDTIKYIQTLNQVDAETCFNSVGDAEERMGLGLSSRNLSNVWFHSIECKSGSDVYAAIQHLPIAPPGSTIVEETMNKDEVMHCHITAQAAPGCDLEYDSARIALKHPTMPNTFTTDITVRYCEGN
jgi:hypothetical protein